jgi:RNA polymerase sigma-70 factor (ECF subfamily)
VSLALALRPWSIPLLEVWLARPLASRALAALPGERDGRSDEALVAAAVGGDRGAYDELYRRTVDLVWRRLTHLLGPDPEREDLAQQIFLEVFGRLERFRGEARFRTFLYRVTVNTALDHLQRRRRRPRAFAPEDFERLVGTDSSPEQRTQERQQLVIVWNLLDRIKPKKRVAFVLRVLEELPLEEVAEQVGASVATVAQRVRHAHEELQRLLARREGP